MPCPQGRKEGREEAIGDLFSRVSILKHETQLGVSEDRAVQGLTNTFLDLL